MRISGHLERFYSPARHCLHGAYGNPRFSPRNFAGKTVFHPHTALMAKVEDQSQITHLYTGRMR